MSEQNIWIITDDFSVEDNNYNYHSSEEEVSVFSIETQRLEQKMTRFLKLIMGTFGRAAQQAEKKSLMCLDEIELSVTLDEEGEVSLVATGREVERQGAIKLKFKRVAS